MEEIPFDVIDQYEKGRNLHIKIYTLPPEGEVAADKSTLKNAYDALLSIEAEFIAEI